MYKAEALLWKFQGIPTITVLVHRDTLKAWTLLKTNSKSDKFSF